MQVNYINIFQYIDIRRRAELLSKFTKSTGGIYIGTLSPEDQVIFNKMKAHFKTGITTIKERITVIKIYNLYWIIPNISYNGKHILFLTCGTSIMIFIIKYI